MIAFLLIALLLIGVPLVTTILATCMIYILNSSFPMSIIAQRTFTGIEAFTLLAIPLFVLAGELMNSSGITERIVRVANALIGHLKSGLAHVNIWASVIFAGISGSAIADSSALGRIFIPNMEKDGYPKDVAAAVTAASSVIGPIIPPSIPIILYALIASNVSVPAMFLAGVTPGILLAVAMSLYIQFFSPNYAPRHPRLPLKDVFKAIVSGLIPILMPFFIVSSIIFGIVTPTEAAAFAVLYSLIAGLFILKTLKFSQLPYIFMKAMRDASVILIIIAVISLANWFLTRARIPQVITSFVLEFTSNPFMFLLLVNIFLLLVGLILEGSSAMLVLVPILSPIATQFGIDPVHFGIVVVLNLMIGLITPPMGLCLFVVDSIAKVGLVRLTRRILPLFLAEVLVLFLITYIPALVTWLPRLMGF